MCWCEIHSSDYRHGHKPQEWLNLHVYIYWLILSNTRKKNQTIVFPLKVKWHVFTLTLGSFRSCWEPKRRWQRRSRWQRWRQRGGAWAPCSRSSTFFTACSRSTSGETCWLDATRLPSSRPNNCTTWHSSLPCWESKGTPGWRKFHHKQPALTHRVWE